MRSAMKERVADIPSDSAPEDMVIDLEDLHLSSQPVQAPAPLSARAVASSEPTTPPAVASSTSFDLPTTSSTLGPSAPISVPLHAASAPHLPLASTPPSKSVSPRPLQTPQSAANPLQRARARNSTPSTPPRASSIQPSASASASMMNVKSSANTSHRHHGHMRTQSHPTIPSGFQFAASASVPNSPSQPLMFGSRYANSAFQHSPSPNVLPKPKFLSEVFMEVDETL